MNPKIYHIVHVDRLASIIADGHLWSDAEARRRRVGGTTIGMNSIKERRLRMPLSSHNGLNVGHCAPFNFCPRSVMLYVNRMSNHDELKHTGGQGPIVHLEADLHRVVDWAVDNGHRWAFTTANASTYYFDDYADLNDLNKIDWEAVRTNRWSGPGIDPVVKGRKQAEFLLEYSLPWELVDRIGIRTNTLYNRVRRILRGATHRPDVAIKPGWYY